MTKQIREIIKINNEDFRFKETPLDDYLINNGAQPNFQDLGTACHRNYEGRWSIKGDYLYLDEIEAFYETGEKFNINDLFPAFDTEIKAEWYNGTITVPLGKRLYTGSIWENKYERELKLEIKKGRIVDKIIIENIQEISLKYAMNLYEKNTKLYRPSQLKKVNELIQLEFDFGNYHLAKKYLDRLLDQIDPTHYGKFKGYYLRLLIKLYKIQIPGDTSANLIYENYQALRDKINNKIDVGEELDMEELNLRKLTFYNLDWVIHWGKYVGYTLRELISEDPEYILWGIRNLSHFAVDHEIFLYPQIREQNTFKEAVTMNYIKIMLMLDWRENDPEFFLTTEENERYYDYENGVRETNHYYDESDVAGSYDPEMINAAYWNID